MGIMGSWGLSRYQATGLTRQHTSLAWHSLRRGTEVALLCLLSAGGPCCCGFIHSSCHISHNNILLGQSRGSSSISQSNPGTRKPGLAPCRRVSPCRTPWWVGSFGMNLKSHTMEEKNQQKRQRELSSSSSSSVSSIDSENNPNQNNPFPTYLYIKASTDKSLDKISPFKIKKIIESTAGTPKSVKIQRNGNIIIQTAHESHARNLLAMTAFDQIPVIVEPHKSLNSTKGIIRCRELRHCSEEEIVDELKLQKVVAAKKIQINRNNEKILTNTIQLTFCTSELPKAVSVGYLMVEVSPFIPNPLRCFKCQAFGHTKFTCKKAPVCAFCGEAEHTQMGERCTATPKCINCKDQHPSFSPKCPMWQSEKEICAIKVKQNISFPQAREIFNKRQPTPSVSYAATAKQHKPITTKSIAIQTCVSWPLGQPDPKKLSEIQPGIHEIDLMPNTLTHGTTQTTSQEQTSNISNQLPTPETSSKIKLTPPTSYSQVQVHVERRPKTDLKANLTKIATNNLDDMDADPFLSPKSKNKAKKKKPSNLPPSK